MIRPNVQVIKNVSYIIEMVKAILNITYRGHKTHKDIRQYLAG